MVENKTIQIQTYLHIKSKEIESSSFIVFPGSLNPNNLSTCKSLNKTEFGANFTFPPGSAIFVFSFGGCTHYHHAKEIQDVGGSIALMGSGIPFVDAIFRFHLDRLNTSVIFITIQDSITLLKTIGKNAGNGFPTIMNFKKEYNIWETLGKGGFWIFLEIVLLLSYLFNFIVGIRSLILHFKKEGLNLSISQTTVWINLIATFIWSMVMFDPWNMRYIANQNFVQVINCFLSPVLLTSVLFLSFFFNEVLIAKGFIKPQLTTLKYPFLAICLSLWACYIANAYYLGSYQTNLTVVKIITFMNILFFGLTGIYFLIMSSLVLFRLKTFNSPVIKRLIPLVSIVFFGILLFVCGSITQAVMAYGNYNGRSWYASWTLIFISSAFILTPQFVYFRKPYISKTSSKHNSEKRDSKINYEKQDSEDNKLVDI